MKQKRPLSVKKNESRFKWKVVSNKKAVSGCPSCPAGTGAAFA